MPGEDEPCRDRALDSADGVMLRNVSTGVILLGLLALAFALVVGRVRRRMGLPVTLRVVAISIAGFVIVVLALWASGHH